MNQLQTIEKDINPTLAQALKLSITTSEDMALASSLRERIKNTIKIVDTVKESEFRPIKTELDLVTEKFSAILKALKVADDKVSKGMGAYQTLLMKEKAEAEAKIAAKVTTGYLKVETAMAKIDALEAPEVLAETNMINKPIPEITDPLAIPREYLTPDMKLIEQELKAGVTIPGVRLIDNYVARAR